MRGYIDRGYGALMESEPSPDAVAIQKDTLPDTDRLRSFIDLCIEYFDSAAGVRISADRARQFQMLFGICVGVIRFAKAHRALVGAGLGIEARPVVRSALEYASTAQYAYLRAGGLDRLYKSAQADSRSLFQRMGTFSGDERFSEMAADVEVPETGRQLPTMTGIMEVLDPDTVLLQPSYAVFSQFTHVTSGALSQYFRVDDSGRIFLDHVSPADAYADESLYVVAASCMLATWIIAHIRDDAEMRAKLDTLSDELMLPLRLDGDWRDADRALDDRGA